MDRSRYPNNWDEIANRLIVERAGLRCEWDGCTAQNAQPHPMTGSLVVLAACHTCDCEPKCGDAAHLLVLCQMHHNRLDARQRVNTAGETRRTRLVDAGQQWLFKAE